MDGLLERNGRGQLKMRVVCDNCRAVYKIPDSKLIKPVNKATCRNCGHRMLIPRPPQATEDERTLVTNNPMTPAAAMPRSAGPPTVPIQDDEPERTLPIANRHYTPEPPPGRRVAGDPSRHSMDEDVALQPGTPAPAGRRKRPPRPSGPHLSPPPEEKTSWVRNPPTGGNAAADTNDALAAAARGMRPSEEPTRIQGRPPELDSYEPKFEESHPAPAQPAPPKPRAKPVSPPPNYEQNHQPSYPPPVGSPSPSHDPSGDMMLALLGTMGAIFGIVLLAIDPRPASFVLDTAVRAIALMLAFGGAFTSMLVLITSSRGRRPAQQVGSIVIASFLAMLGVGSAIGLNTMAYLWKTGFFTSQATVSIPADFGTDAVADLPPESEAIAEEPVEVVAPTTNPPRRAARRTVPRTTKKAPPKKVVTVPSPEPEEDLFEDDDFGFDDPEPPPPVRTPPPPTKKAASSGDSMESVPMEVIDIQLRNNIDVKKCFFGHMQSNGALPKRVDVRFTLEPSGKVSRAAITQAQFAGSSLDSCLSKAIKKIQFPPTSGAATKITFPFIFE